MSEQNILVVPDGDKTIVIPLTTGGKVCIAPDFRQDEFGIALLLINSKGEERKLALSMEAVIAIHETATFFSMHKQLNQGKVFPYEYGIAPRNANQGEGGESQAADSSKASDDAESSAGNPQGNQSESGTSNSSL